MGARLHRDHFVVSQFQRRPDLAFDVQAPSLHINQRDRKVAAHKKAVHRGDESVERAERHFEIQRLPLAHDHLSRRELWAALRRGAPDRHRGNTLSKANNPTVGAGFSVDRSTALPGWIIVAQSLESMMATAIPPRKKQTTEIHEAMPSCIVPLMPCPLVQPPAAPGRRAPKAMGGSMTRPARGDRLVVAVGRR
jgi:hypothetical protein